MEQVHGVDVSWMTHGTPKGMCLVIPSSHVATRHAITHNTPPVYQKKLNKSSPPSKTPAPALPRQIPGASPRSSPPPPSALSPTNGQANGHTPSGTPNGGHPQRRLSRSGSIDKESTSPSVRRRNSWFSNISSKFSSSPPPAAPPASQPLPSSPTAQLDPVPPKIAPAKNAVLPHAARSEGDGPYIPAPPRSEQAGFLGVLRRLSSSSGALSPHGRIGHGLVDRVVLNVDHARERCPIAELHGSKLRRVAFCVDVEIAPMPKYADGDAAQSKPIDKSQKKKLTEKGEGEALKNAKAIEEQTILGTPKPTPESLSKESSKEAPKEEPKPATKEIPKEESKEPPKEAAKELPADADMEKSKNEDDNALEKDKENTKKKEKKKKSEEERKARKEKKRKLAEANGSIPMEIRYDGSDSSAAKAPSKTPSSKTTGSPTTNPVRIYRRCCQLRETPILKKITEQLNNADNYSASTGLVNKLDLTGYWLQLPDLITLGDYMAVVPVREVIMENSGLTDEGLRVILAGLLAAKRPALRRKKPKHEEEDQGGVVERLVLKDNKLGPDGWKHLSLFVYLCRSLKYLDVSKVAFPRQCKQNGNLPNGVHIPMGVSDIFSKALGERLAGSSLELVNIGETEPSMEQLGTVIDGLIRCGVKRLGLAHNHINDDGLQHVIKYLAAGKCEGIDLGGNDLGGHMEKLASSITEDSPLWAISLAGCSVTPSSLCKILPTLVKLKNLRFIDLSHNHALFQSTPSAVGLLRRYLPKMPALKRIHLEDSQLTPEQAIAIVEIVPEIHSLAHINILGNSELVKLADAQTEEAQEEACALYASLLAAARVSKSLICVDIEVPSDRSGEIVKAMARQVVAYCLRNMERFPDADVSAAVASALSENAGDLADPKATPYPDVLVHLVGHDVFDENESVSDNDSAPDEDYVIGGTGVVKALACCLKNRGDESGRQSGEFIRDVENGVSTPDRHLPPGGKVKDMSKHLLVSARKIRHRLQPALNKAKANPGDELNLRKLIFLDDTLQGIIKRFEDEYPDARQPEHVARRPSVSSVTSATKSSIESVPTGGPQVEDPSAALSDNEDEGDFHAEKEAAESNSLLSKTLAQEEGRILRVGHQFRLGFLKQEQIDLLALIDTIGNDPKHAHMLYEMAEDIGGELLELVKQKGATRAFKENKDFVFKLMEESDPDHWERFVEAQQKARANITVPKDNGEHSTVGDESAIAD